MTTGQVSLILVGIVWGGLWFILGLAIGGHNSRVEADKTAEKLETFAAGAASEKKKQ